MTRSSYEVFLDDAENRRIFEQESLAIEATELISELMEKQDVKKADLAKEIGKSKAFVTQVLGGSRNMTMHTFADFAFALGHRVVLSASPLEKAGMPVTQSFSVAPLGRRYSDKSPQQDASILPLCFEAHSGYAA